MNSRGVVLGFRPGEGELWGVFSRLCYFWVFFYLSVFWRILGNFVLFRLIIPLVKYLIFLELFSFFFVLVDERMSMAKHFSRV